MPSGRDLKRLQSENRRLREELEAANLRPAALDRQVQELTDQVKAADGRVETTIRLMSELVTEKQAWLDQKAEYDEVLALRYEDWQLAQAVEMGRREGALAAERANFVSSLEETLEDLDATEARLNELWTRIQERGRRKEVQSVHADMNRAILGCSRSRKAIQDKVAELRAREPKEEGRVFRQPYQLPEDQRPVIVTPVHTLDESISARIVGKAQRFEAIVLPADDDLVTYRSKDGGAYEMVHVEPNMVTRDLEAIQEHARWLDDGGPDIGGEAGDGS